MPTISILMPVYNGASYLQEAIESILNQTFVDFEFIIIDDGSIDNTATILDGYKDPRIVRLINKKNLGLVKALNYGLEIAQGEFIARMDADDISLVQRFKKQIAFLEIHPEIGVLGTQMKQVDEDSKHSSIVRAPLFHEMIVWKMLFTTSIFHATVIMQKALIMKVGGYSSSFPHLEDLDLWLRLSYITRFANHPEALYIRRWHKDSICNIYGDLQYQNAQKLRHRFYEKLLNKRIEPDIIDRLSGSLLYVGPLAQDQLKEVIALMIELYESLVIKTSSSPSTIGIVRMDLITQIERLVTWNNEHNRSQSSITLRTLLQLFLRRLPPSMRSQMYGIWECVKQKNLFF